MGCLEKCLFHSLVPVADGDVVAIMFPWESVLIEVCTFVDIRSSLLAKHDPVD